MTENYNPYLYSKLTAYRKTHSCETTLIGLIEEWKQAADRKENVVARSTEMSKAFDSLHPSLMIKKLEAYGFCQASLQLMRSFFSERFNRVKLNGKISTWKHVKMGCPQESSFGPLLWNIFQNVWIYEVNDDSLYMYADDHLVKEVELASSWYKENLLQTNTKKYQILTIIPKRQRHNIYKHRGKRNNFVKNTEDPWRRFGWWVKFQ